MNRSRSLRWRGLRLLAAGLTVAATAPFLEGCGARSVPPARLVDGSAPAPVPRALARLADRGVVSRVRVIAASRLGSAGQACLDSFRAEYPIERNAHVLQRTAVLGESLTLRDADRSVVLGCDRTARTPRGQWCARSVGGLSSGRLRDPRVDILCRDRDGDPVGFAWVEPAPNVRWVEVELGPRVEIDAVAAQLPVRIATHDVDGATASARFRVTEYAAGGERLRRYRFRAGVAG